MLLTGSGVIGQGEWVGVGGDLRVADAAVAVLAPDADGVVEVGQVVGLLIGARVGLVVERLDRARGAEEELQAAHGGWNGLRNKKSYNYFNFRSGSLDLGTKYEKWNHKGEREVHYQLKRFSKNPLS